MTRGKGIVATEEKEVTVAPGTVILIPAGHFAAGTAPRPDSDFRTVLVIAWTSSLCHAATFIPRLSTSRATT